MKIRDKDALDYHELPIPGKLSVEATKPCLTQMDLSLAYSPGVAIPCNHIEANPEDAFKYTGKGNLVAVISNGTAVLGLGAIGALAGKPVMEGKGVLFKRFAGINVFDIELETRDTAEIIRAVEMMEPTFGGVNLEDIKAPECFEIEETLKARMNIPVFHDDQHGTAIISGAALINACEITGRKIEDCKIVVCGAGAAGIACAEFYVSLGAKRENTIMTDSKGVIYKGREAGMNKYKEMWAVDTDKRSLADAMAGSDVFTGVAVKDMVTPEMLLSMNDKPIVFAMANPDPEIPYDLAKQTRDDVVMGTGRSDFPNQVNNVLGFPFIFRGALDVRAKQINEEMKLAAAYALAKLAKEPVPEPVRKAYGGAEISFGPEYLIPKPFDPRVLLWVSPAVARAAMESGVARKPIEDFDAYQMQLEAILGAKRPVQILISRAKQAPKKIVLPEATEDKVLQAAEQMYTSNIGEPVLVGNSARIHARMQALGIELPATSIVDPAEDDRAEGYIATLARLRERRGVTLGAARRMLRDPLYYGLMMLREGAGDGLICGINRGYPETIRPTLEVIDRAPGNKLCAGMYMLALADKVLFFADATIVIEPTAHQLAEIAMMAAAEVKKVFHLDPRVAMISFSNFGSASHPLTRKVRQAVELVRERQPELTIDGEMQADTALVPEIAAAFPHSRIQGDANILIFPDLQSGNVAYKLVQHLGKADLLGPILLGLSKPVNVLNHYSTVGEIVNLAAVTTVGA